MNSTINPVMKSLRLIGDLDHEFYDDERQREVWNEASAVGLQSATWLALIAAAVLPWAAGTTGAWTALGLLVAVSITSFIACSYAGARGVDVYAAISLRRARTLLINALYIVSGVGIAGLLVFRDLPPTALLRVLVGGIVGAAIGVGALSVGLRRKRREEAEFDAFEEL